MESAIDKAEALREELRSGRRTNKTSSDTIGHSEITDGSIGSGVQIAGRDNGKAKRDTAGTRSNKRSAKEIVERVRQGSRRHGNNGGSASNGDQPGRGDTAAATTGVAIERLDDVPTRIDNEIPLPAPVIGRYREDYAKTERGGKYMYYLIADRSQIITPEEYKALPHADESKSSSNFAGITENIKKVTDTLLPGGKGSTLSNAEAKEYAEPLAAALVDYGGYLDKFLQMRSGDPLMPDVWGDLTEMEAAVLARIMIRRGQKNAAAAEMVRTLVNGDDYIQSALIVVPRIIKTTEVLRSSRRSKVQVVK